MENPLKKPTQFIFYARNISDLNNSSHKNTYDFAHKHDVISCQGISLADARDALEDVIKIVYGGCGVVNYRVFIKSSSPRYKVSGIPIKETFEFSGF